MQSEGLSAAEVNLFEQLRRWRLVTARKKGIPACRVLTNRVLFSLVRRKPQSKEALRAIPGVGDGTVTHYGRTLLSKLATS
jgi:DNA topoisomerase-3